MTLPRTCPGACRPRVAALLAGAVAMAALALPGSARAQFNPFSIQNASPLTRADRDARAAALRKLLETDPAKVGQSESWAGAKSGNSGTVTIRRVFQQDNMPCREVAAQDRYKSGSGNTPGGNALTAVLCRVPSGQWKFAS